MTGDELDRQLGELAARARLTEPERVGSERTATAIAAPPPPPHLVPALVSLGVVLAEVRGGLRLVGGSAEPDPAPCRGPASWHDSAIPVAYQGEPRALHARARPALRKATSERPAAERYGALFLGPSRAGKSSAAAWALRRWKSGQGRGLRGTIGWLDALAMTDGDRRYRLGTGDPEELALAYRVDWLVLDDVNLSSSATLLQLVLSRRYGACLPTIVTTGLREAELVGHIGAAACRRILEFQGVSGPVVDCHERPAP